MIDQFFGREWSKEYTCLKFVSEAWPVMTNRPFPDVQQQIDGGLADKATGQFFKRIKEPHDFCLVSFQAGHGHHVGIYYKRRILHLTATGVQFQPLEVAAITFRRIRFYDVK